MTVIVRSAVAPGTSWRLLLDKFIVTFWLTVLFLFWLSGISYQVSAFAALGLAES
jgi:hypothetical protein